MTVNADQHPPLEKNLSKQGTLSQQNQPPASGELTSGQSKSKLPSWLPFVKQFHATKLSKERQQMSQLSYFHGYMSEQDCALMLVKSGDFLLRCVATESNAETDVLSVFCNGKVRNLLLHRTPDQKLVFIRQLAFDNVQKLVHYYKHEKMPLLPHTQLLLVNQISRQSWELIHEQVILHKAIGQGAFGQVYRGRLRLHNHNNAITVAIKEAKLDEQTANTTDKKNMIENIITEAALLRKFRHPNIVRFYGVAASQEPVMIVMEFVNGGGLDNFVIKYQDKLRARDHGKYCTDAARGLRYLHHKHFLHKDVASRNCLLDEKTETCKISDFGLSQDMRHPVKLEKVATRWTAPEIWTKKTYTSKSDVYSYGIMMWEVYNNCAVLPFGTEVKGVKQRIIKGERPPMPKDMPAPVQKLLARCWLENPSKRPTMHEITLEMERVHQMPAEVVSPANANIIDE